MNMVLSIIHVCWRHYIKDIKSQKVGIIPKGSAYFFASQLAIDRNPKRKVKSRIFIEFETPFRTAGTPKYVSCNNSSYKTYAPSPSPSPCILE